MASAFDLTPFMAPFFDTHMVGPLLDFLREGELYDAKVVTKEKIKTMMKTNLIDLIEDEYAKFPEDGAMQAEFNAIRGALDKRRDELFDKIDNEPEDVKLVSAFFANQEEPEEGQSKPTYTAEMLATSHGISVEALENYYKFAKFQYECGQYNVAEEMLGNFLSIAQSQTSSVLGARWGRLACRILGAKWELALQDLASVKEAIDIRNIAPTDQIRQRAWLMHWALFVYINQKDGVDALADFFSERVYLQTIENLCPWLLRYYTAFVVLSPTRRQKMLRGVLTEIGDMSYQYSDPMTEFLSGIFKEFDFSIAQEKLKQCQTLIKNDFFLQIYQDKFMHEARVLICEMYCTINKRVDLVMLSEQLQMTEEEAERWMVDMVLNGSAGSSQDAKVDASAKQIIMAAPNKAAHQNVMDKTRDYTVRSSMLMQTMGTMLSDQAALVRSKQMRGDEDLLNIVARFPVNTKARRNYNADKDRN
jgi:translation initiation factor 3 subunit E